MDRLIRLPDVLNVVQIGESTLYKYIARGLFPRPIKVGAMSMWSEEELNKWRAERLAERDAA